MSLYDQVKQKKKTTKSSIKQVQQVKKVVEKKYKKNYYSSGNMVKDKMSNQTYFNSQPENPKYKAQNANLKDDRLYLTGGRAKKNVANYDSKSGTWNYTGRKDYKYKPMYIKNAGTHDMSHTSKSGKKTKGVTLLAPNQMKEYERNLNKSWGQDKYNNSPINKVDPNGKSTSARIRNGLKYALKTSTPLGKIGAIAGTVAKGGGKGVLEVLDGLNTLNYGAHGATSGFVEGMNNNGKLDKGELGRAFSNAGRKGKKGIRAGLTTNNEGRYGFYDTLKSFSDDKVEDDLRKGKALTTAQEKKRLSKLMWGGLGLDLGGALLTANAGTLATKGASLLGKGNKIGGSLVKGLSNVAKVSDLGIDLPIADLIRGSGKTLRGTKATATTFDEIAPKLMSKLDEMGKGANTPALEKNLIDKTVNQINKGRGVRTPKHGVKLGGYEIMQPNTVQKIADSPLNVPGRALNSVIDKIHSTRRATAYTGDAVDNIMMGNIRKGERLGNINHVGGRVEDEVATDLQLLARGSSREEWIKQRILQQRMGVRAPHSKKDEEILLNAQLNNTPYWSRRAEESMDNHFGTQMANDIIPNTDLTPDEMKVLEWRKQQELDRTNNTYNARKVMVNQITPPVSSISPNIAPIVEDKPALQNMLSKIRPVKNATQPMRMTEQGSDGFYDYLEKNNTNMYNKFTGESDVADNIIDRDIYRAEKRMDNNYVKEPSDLTQIPAPKRLNTAPETNIQNNVVNAENIEALRKKYDKYFGERLTKEIKYNKQPIKKNPNEISHNERRTTFQNTLKDMFKPNLDKKSILQKQADIENATKLLAEKTLARKDKIGVINKLNDIVFDGKKVLSHNAEKRDLNQLVSLLNKGLDNSHNEVPEILNKPISEIKKYMESVTDDNYKAKYDKRIEVFKTTKTALDKQINSIKAKGKLTVADREAIRKLEKTKLEFGQWWDKHGKMTPDEWEKAYPTTNPELKGFDDAVEENAGNSRYAEHKSTEYYGIDDVNYKDMNVLYKSYKDGSLKSSDLSEKEKNIIKYMTDQEEIYNRGKIDEVAVDRTTTAPQQKGAKPDGHIDNVRKQFDLPKTTPSKAKIKLSDGQKLGTIPPVKENLANLRKTIEREVELKHKNPAQHAEVEQAFKQIKRDYVDTLRSYGLRDEQYFHKVTALQKELDKQLSKPLMKMDITHLSRKITKTFDEIENTSVKHTPLDKMDDNVGGFEKFAQDDYQKWNAKNVAKETKKATKSVKMSEKDRLNTLDRINERLKGSNITKETPLERLVDEDGVITPQNKYRRPKGYNKRLQEEIDKIDEYANEYTPDGDVKTLTPGARTDKVEPLSKEARKVLAKTGHLRGVEGKLKPIDNPYIDEKDVSHLKPPEYSTKHLNEDGEVIANTTGKPRNYDEVAVTSDKLQNKVDEITKKQSDSTKRVSVLDGNDEGEVRDSLLSMNLRNNAPKGKGKTNPLEKLLKGYDALTREFKAGVTTNNPGWHTMNAIQNKMNSSYGIGNGIFDMKANKQAKDVVNNMKGQRQWMGMNVGKAPKTDAELSKIMVNDEYSLKDIKDISEQEGLIDDTFMNDLGNPKSKIAQYLAPSGDRSIWGGLGANKLVRTEENDKMHHLISSLKQGKNSADAVDSVNRTLFDYDDITDAEKNIAKRIMPFYTYYRKNIPLQINQTLNSPRAMATYTDAKNQFEKGIDDEDKQRRDEWTANRLQVPNTTKEEKGRPDTMYNKMYNPSTPWDALMQLPTPSSEGINNLPSANPILESLARYYSTGKDMFGNSYKDNNKNILDVLIDQYAKPTMGVAGKAMDLGKQNSKENDRLLLLQMLTGLKTKYYKSNQEWDFKDDKKPYEAKKKVLMNKYK